MQRFLFATVKLNELRSGARSLIKDSSRKMSVGRPALKAHPLFPGTHASTAAVSCFIHISPIYISDSTIFPMSN